MSLTDEFDEERIAIDPATIVTVIIGIIKIATGLGWWTRRDWRDELCGHLTDDASTGEMINQLEELSGRTYPYLRDMLQEVVDAWRSFQRGWPTEERAYPYDTKLRKFADAVVKEAEAIAEDQGIAYELLPWYLKYLPYGLMAGLGVGLIIVLARRKRRK